MPHVLCLRPVHPEALERLRGHPGVTVELMADPTPENLAPVLPYTEAVIVRATRIDEAFLSKAPELRIVARHGVGYDAVDVPALREAIHAGKGPLFAQVKIDDAPEPLVLPPREAAILQARMREAVLGPAAHLQ